MTSVSWVIAGRLTVVVQECHGHASERLIAGVEVTTIVDVDIDVPGYGRRWQLAKVVVDRLLATQQIDTGDLVLGRINDATRGARFGFMVQDAAG